MDFLTSRKGTLFTEEAPRWVSKLGIGMGMGFGVLLVAILVSNRRNNKILDDSQVNEHDLWIPVSITVDDQPQKQRFDEGMILLENDVLLFSGNHYSFRVDLSDVEVTHFSLRKNWTALKEKSTGRKLFIALANKYSLANWRLFIDQIQATAAPQGSPSLFAWKPRWLQSLTTFAAIFAMLATNELLVFLAWHLSLLTPTYRHLAYPLIFLALLFLSVTLLLWSNLRHWHSYKQRKLITQT